LGFRSDGERVVAGARAGGGVGGGGAVIECVRAGGGMRRIVIPFARDSPAVAAMFTAPGMLAIPFECGAEVAGSAAMPAWPVRLLGGGYAVRPVPAPSSSTNAAPDAVRGAGSGRVLRLFGRGGAVSVAPGMTGGKGLEYAPVMTGVAGGKIVIVPCAVATLLWS
jgi:hypothetical protein